MKTRALLVVGCLLLSCGPRSRPASAAAGPVSLPVLAADARPPFVLEQRLRGRHGEHEVDAHVVLQWHEGLLRLVGLAPFGARAFVVEQRGGEVRVENSLGRELPFDPRHVLLDIHRVLFSGFASAQADGDHELHEGDGLIRERWQGGHVIERRFMPVKGQGGVVVSFSGSAAPVLSRRVRLVNEALGYELEIETLTQQWLE